MAIHAEFPRLCAVPDPEPEGVLTTAAALGAFCAELHAAGVDAHVVDDLVREAGRVLLESEGLIVSESA